MKPVNLSEAPSVSVYPVKDTSMAKSNESKLKAKLPTCIHTQSPGKAKKKKMAWPRRVLRILESGKRVHFQNVSMSKKRQMCINRYLPFPASNKATPSDREESGKSPLRCNPDTTIVMEVSRSVTNDHCSIPKEVVKSDASGWHEANRYQYTNGEANKTKHENHFCKEVVAIDCEMVGLGPKGCRSALARCSIVDHSGNVIYDKYVKPGEPITDYRTKWSGIRPRNMVDAIPFQEARDQIQNILKDKVVVGHSIGHDFDALQLFHPQRDVRDTSKCSLLNEIFSGKKSCKPGQHYGLKSLAKHLLGINVQKGEHSSVEDAQATMDLYKLVEDKWEEELSTSFLDDHFWPEELS